MPKFMQTLESNVYDKLVNLAQDRGVSVQELVRAVIIPEWMKVHWNLASENARLRQGNSNPRVAPGIGELETNRVRRL